jgi:hypothetical protein
MVFTSDAISLHRVGTTGKSVPKIPFEATKRFYISHNKQSLCHKTVSTLSVSAQLFPSG